MRSDHVTVADSHHRLPRITKSDIQPPGLVEWPRIVGESRHAASILERRVEARHHVLLDDNDLERLFGRAQGRMMRYTASGMNPREAAMRAGEELAHEHLPRRLDRSRCRTCRSASIPAPA